MPDIEIFTGRGCQYCAAAKVLLDGRGLRYTECDVSDPGVLATYRRRLPRVRALPQIFVDGDHIGGFEDLQIWLKE